MSHLKKFLRMKYCLSHDHKVDIIYGGEVLTDDFSLMDVAYTFAWNKTTPMRFKFRLLQRYTVPVPDPPPAKETTIQEASSPPTVPSEPESPSPSSLPLPPAPKELPAKVQLKTLTVQVQKLSSKISEPVINNCETKSSKTEKESSIACNNTSNNISNNNNINNNNNSPPKAKPLARQKPRPKSKTEKQKQEPKPVMKTSPERVNLKRNHQVEVVSKETNEASKQKDDYYEPEKKKSKLLGNDTNKNLDNPPQIEPFKVNKNEKVYEEKVEEKKRKKEEKQMIVEEKKDYDDDEMYEIGKWHMDDKAKSEEKKPLHDKKQVEESKKNEELLPEGSGFKEERLKDEKKFIENKKTEEKRNSEEKKMNGEKRKLSEKTREETKINEESVRSEAKKFFKEKSYIEKFQEEEDDEDRLRILTPPVEEMMVEEKVPEPAPPPPVAEVQPMMRSEERRKEKKKNKKAKHHHHHRHHDRKRDSPPAATILHSSENDIMKLKIKLTEVNSKSPKYSVVDGSSEDRKEPKENGHNHKSGDKYAEKEKYKEKEKEKNKIKSDEPQLIGEIINNKNDYTHSSKLETICREKLQQIRQSRPKIPIKQTITKQNNVKQDVANVKPIMQSPPLKMQSPPPRQSPSPKSIPPKSVATPKPTLSQQQQQSQQQHPQITPKMNGTMEPLKMPPSTTITVSKITAEEKRQMEQQKLLMSRNNNNGLDSKRPSLEIMLVNAPKKPESLIQSVQQMNNDNTKPVEVIKKVMRPTPPSIPLSRLGKNVNFGAKGSPPPLVLAAPKTCHDDSGALDLSGKSSRKSPDIDPLSMRNLVTLSDTAVQIRNGIHPMDNTTTSTSNSNISQLKIPMPGLTKPVYHSQQQQQHQQPQSHHQRLIKPGQNQTVRQIPNPSALMYRQQTINGRSLIPPPALPLSSLRKMESMTKNLEKVTAGLPVKAIEAAGYATK
uniref:RAWUL domain-containing protein n=2 Tax=Rhodnius prolixus TaxID=13249 RepID=T1IAT2_RHOPR